jgi:hypothetical protein
MVQNFQSLKEVKKISFTGPITKVIIKIQKFRVKICCNKPINIGQPTIKLKFLMAQMAQLQ